MIIFFSQYYFFLPGNTLEVTIENNNHCGTKVSDVGGIIKGWESTGSIVWERCCPVAGNEPAEIAAHEVRKYFPSSLSLLVKPN